jgi:ABC-type multidrug transport system fused ATPase/permease subunit
MDEATSALDNQTQTIVTESLDRIYVVEAGIVVQSGTFDELVKQEGLFARLVARQLD